VMVANADGTGVRQLGTADGQKQVMLSGPVWSPDGKVIIAPARSLEGRAHSLFLECEAGTGQSKPVGGRWANVSDSAWMPDGRSFLAVAADFAATRTQLWQVSYPSGERRRVTMDLN